MLEHMDDKTKDALIIDRPSKRIVARRPQRKPGKLRFRKLLDALDQLLASNNVQDIGLYQIAAQAKVPNASVYHFFPNAEAALLALAEVHHEALREQARQYLSTPPRSWQDLFRQKLAAAAQYHNNHPAALRLFMGTNISAEVKSADISQYHRLVDERTRLLEHYFHLPVIPDWRRRLAIYFAMVDGVFALSYNENGFIRDEDIAEAYQAGTSYLRCYLPEFLAPRESQAAPALEG